MRKLLFIVSIAIGALVALMFSFEEGWMTQVVIAAFGALIGAAIGGAMSARRERRSWKRRHVRPVAIEVPGMGAAMADLDANFWRDRDHAPFTKPWDALPDRHQFHPDKHE